MVLVAATPRGGSSEGNPSKLRFDPKQNSHNLLTHFPMDPNCPICSSCKRNRSHCRSKKHGEPDQLPEPKKFADAMTADHKILNEDDESREHDRVALIVMDRFTRWLQGYASNSKSAEEVVRDLQRFLGPQVKPQHVYTDNSKEFIRALKDLNWPHDTSTPHRPQTNGIIERAVRVVKEGTSCVMVQSGLAEKWWPEAMNCFCFLRNVSTVLETGNTAYKNRFGSDFSGPLIPFGAEVTYLPITHQDKPSNMLLVLKCGVPFSWATTSMLGEDGAEIF
jgi:hypothetical protein